MDLQKNNFHPKTQKILNLLRQKLSFNQIFKDQQLMAAINPLLQIKLQQLLQINFLKAQTKQNVLDMIAQTSFLRYSKVVCNGRQEEVVQLRYENSSRILLVTGVYKHQISKFVKKFTDNYIKSQNHLGLNPPLATVGNYNGFWVTITTIHQQIAHQLTVFLRGRKKTMETGPEASSFKIDNRRIRIILLNEDLLSVLVEAMTQYKAEQFNRAIEGNPSIRRPRQQVRQDVENAKKSINYRLMPIKPNPNYSIVNDQSYHQQSSFKFSQGNFLLSNYINKTTSSNKQSTVKIEKGVQTDLCEQKQQDRISQQSQSKNGESVNTREETEKQQFTIKEEYILEQETTLIIRKSTTDKKLDSNFSANQSQQDQLSLSSNSTAPPDPQQTVQQPISCEDLGLQSPL